MDRALVDQSRSTFAAPRCPRSCTAVSKLEYADEAKAPLRLDLAAGTGAPLIFVRRSGLPLSEPMPALYTRTVFREINSTGKYDLVRQFASDAWVFGGDPLDLARSATLITDVISLYEQDYIRAWDEVLRDVTLKQTVEREGAGRRALDRERRFLPVQRAVGHRVDQHADLLREEKSAAGEAAKRMLDGRAAPARADTR